MQTYVNASGRDTVRKHVRIGRVLCGQVLRLVSIFLFDSSYCYIICACTSNVHCFIARVFVIAMCTPFVFAWLVLISLSLV